MPSSEATTFLAPACVMPFCKGCGHSHVLRKVNEALITLALDPSDVCLVTDIGCIGLADSVFETPHSVHTTHGRSTAFATGIALADSVLTSNRLKTIVLIGDGGSMIGLLHIVNAALLNADVTVIVCNNFLFGMTGGQNSALSPLDFVTPTTPLGNIIPPLDVCAVVADCHAEFVARHLATDKALTGTLAEAIRRPGFALVEVVELCTEHGTTRNALSGKNLEEIVRSQGQELGILVDAHERSEFGAVYREKFPKRPVGQGIQGDDVCEAQPQQFGRQLGIVLAGSAGEKVQSAAHAFCLSMIRKGLYCTQKSDNPVTQGSGFSLSELVISYEPISYTGIETPDAVIVVSWDGLRELEVQGLFARLAESSLLLLDESLTPPPCRAKVMQVPFRAGGGKNAAAAALQKYAALAGLFESTA